MTTCCVELKATSVEEPPPSFAREGKAALRRAAPGERSRRKAAPVAASVDALAAPAAVEIGTENGAQAVEIA
jgi:hypothetical protein